MKSLENLIRVKTALAEKYEHLALLSGSRPRQTSLKHRAASYRRQIQALQRR